MRYALLSLILLAGVADAETFRCQEGAYWQSSGTVVVVATINEDRITGTIKLAGATYQAKYHVQGFDRRWDFGLNAEYEYDLALVISPSGIALYYDFSRAELGETVQHSQTFVCT
ncbi:exported protein of unknown function [uncultured Woeseiaceae bacterium]|uniref:Uncharacterized protein n=1 Tax=uncultured Woeseiaceae bacterium TaxID=1983305 RepID=A0A7D9H936_9GAMM|nr:exported protein of unknown function [uncultured Woeseiaceae bacterium]